MLWNTAYAQAANSAQSPWSSFIVMGIIFGIFYFLIIRPAQAKAKKEQALVNELKKGDEVYTRSGLIGTIYGITEKIVTLEVSEGVRVKVIKNQVSGLVSSLSAPAKTK